MYRLLEVWPSLVKVLHYLKKCEGSIQWLQKLCYIKLGRGWQLKTTRRLRKQDDLSLLWHKAMMGEISNK
jgi:hypothetical protein